ncbi:hypothetical protein [Saccharopolyspora sp. 5N708]|uniref:hypothetical protein n=1 Tax=Saccharopolyspora sp. 5N708 TaxID=3457424 RepID=UPI003FD427D5
MSTTTAVAPLNIQDAEARIAEDLGALAEDVPTAFWNSLREQEIIAADAPVPVS